MAPYGILDWYRSIPQITRYWITGSVILTLFGIFGFLDPMNMVLSIESVIYKFQIWRPVTAVLFFPVYESTWLHYIVNLSHLWFFSAGMERGIFDGKPAEYVFMLLFNWICLVIIGFIGELNLLMDSMVISVMQIWCQLNKDVILTFRLGPMCKAMYVPWVIFGINIILGGGWLSVLIGIIVAHLYFYLMFKYPQDFGGVRLLNTPQFLYKLFPNRIVGVSGFGVPPPIRQQDDDNGNHGYDNVV